MNENPERKIVPIMNLATRREIYWRSAAFAAAELCLSLVLVTAGCIACVKYFATPWHIAALVAALIMAPPIWLMWPAYPTQDDVMQDQARRRAAGLPDDVEN